MAYLKFVYNAMADDDLRPGYIENGLKCPVKDGFVVPIDSRSVVMFDSPASGQDGALTQRQTVGVNLHNLKGLVYVSDAQEAREIEAARLAAVNDAAREEAAASV